jgi:SPRY domain-containing SOCS box protein 1/4
MSDSVRDSEGEERRGKLEEICLYSYPMDNLEEIYKTEHYKPEYLDYLLEMPSAIKEEQERHGWDPEVSSPNMLFFNPCTAQPARPLNPLWKGSLCGCKGYKQGLHVWEIHWPLNDRGANSVVGVGTKYAALHRYLVGNDADSWGWSVSYWGGMLYHDFQNVGDIVGMYPCSLPDNFPMNVVNFVVPDKFQVVLDMDEGTLGFIVHSQYLGVAFCGLKGKKLFPMISDNCSSSEISIRYINGHYSVPLTLMGICRQVIREQVGEDSLQSIELLPLPSSMKKYLY